MVPGHGPSRARPCRPPARRRRARPRDFSIASVSASRLPPVVMSLPSSGVSRSIVPCSQSSDFVITARSISPSRSGLGAMWHEATGPLSSTNSCRKNGAVPAFTCSTARCESDVLLPPQAASSGRGRCEHRDAEHQRATAAAETSLRAAAAIASASMPAAASSSAGLPEPGISRTARCANWSSVAGERREDGLAEASLGPVVLDDDDPSVRRLDRLAQRVRVDRLQRVEVDHARRRCRPSASASAAFSASCSVMPAPTSVTSSPSRTTFAPPTGKSSSAS